MYQALYRKWRPKVFADVIGQAHITETLRRQAAEDRLSHAYLFTGTRGTGKTTCAKILAKAANCQQPKDGDPCGVCPACLGIDSGAFLDVLELDAASNNGVDHVRALRDDAIYSPVHVRKRVYIIDEVHMLSTPAFNALLKILEEPPAHLMFILATTELHKVPPTILSRCQRFSFKRIAPEDIAARLSYVAVQEGIDLRHDGAELLSRLADGALRDGLSLLDQCAAMGGRIDAAAVLDTLGLAGRLQIARLMEHILARDTAAALLLLDALYTDGRDVDSVLKELSALARDLLLRQAAPKGGAALLSGGFDAATMERLGAGVKPARLMAISTCLQKALTELNTSINRRTDAELCLLRLCDESLCGDLTALTARIERLEAGGLPQTAASAPVAPPPMASPPPPTAFSAASQAPAMEPPPWDIADEAQSPSTDNAAPPTKPKAAVTPLSSAAGAAGGDGDLWASMQESCKNRLSSPKRAFLGMAGGQLTGDTMTVYCGSDLVKNSLQVPEVETVLTEQLSAGAGRPIRVVFSLDSYSPPAQDKLNDLIQFGAKLDHFEVT